MSNKFITKKAIKVSQVFGDFFVTSFTAEELLSITFSDPFREEDGILKGNQRAIEDKRKEEIRKYINSTECAFPNSIILAANFNKDTGLIVDDDSKDRWDFKEKSDGFYELHIPKDVHLAAIIDGQHRLSGFRNAHENTLSMELVCSIYFDLPSSLQAFLFATINSTQKAVNKSLAYSLFGFELEEEDAEFWSPDQAAISICRKLNNEEKSPLYGRVKSASTINGNKDSCSDWQISIACLCDCILRLISTNPKDDKSLMHDNDRDKHSRMILLGERLNDKSPLRPLYLSNDDFVIFRVIENFFNAVQDVYKNNFTAETALCKTIGIQGLFDVLKVYFNTMIAKMSIKFPELDNDEILKKIDLKKSAFIDILAPSKDVDFSQDFFLKFSGVGRQRVRDVVLCAASLKEISNIKNEETRKEVANILKVSKK